MNQSSEDNVLLNFMKNNIFRKRNSPFTALTFFDTVIYTKHGLGKKTNLHYTAILEATLHKEDIEKEW